MTHPPAAHRVARHTTLSLLGFALPLAIALLAIPVAARGLGPARFGLLGLAWAIVEYLAFFDLGLSRATVRSVAHALATASRDLRQMVAVSISAQAVCGVALGLVVWFLAPFATRLLGLPPELESEGVAMFHAVAGNVAIVLLMSGLRGVLEGAQRFDLAVALRIPGSAAATLIPAAGAVLGASLPEILWTVGAVRVLLVLALIAAVRLGVPTFRWEYPREWWHLRPLVGYGRWLLLSSAANAVLINFDRFALAAVAGVAAVGFYTAPYEGATRLLIIPASMFAALFPALSATEALADRQRTTRYLESAARQTVLVLVPVIAVLVVFAPDILRLWIGEEFSMQGATALRILGVGVLVNALASVPSVFLYAAGRPDIPAKIHLGELLLHVPLTLFLVRRFGVSGAAAAWTIRVTVDALMLALIAGRFQGWRVSAPRQVLWLRACGALLLFSAGLLAARILRGVDTAAIVTLLATAVVAGAIGWTKGLAPEERAAWRATVRGPKRASGHS